MCFSLLLLSPSLSIACAGGCFSAGYYWFEKKRAQSCLKTKAIDIFMEQMIVPEKVMKYLALNPDAARQLCQHPKVSLEKVESKEGKTLLEKAIDIHDKVCDYKIKQSKAVIEEIVLNGSLEKEELRRLFFNPKLSVESAILLLKRREIISTDFSSEGLAQCLDKVKYKVVESMLQHGFQPDIQRNLTSAIINKQWKKVSVYLRTGVQLPELNKEFLIFNEFYEVSGKSSLGEHFAKEPKSRKIFNQLQEKKPLSFPKINVGGLEYWKPVISTGKALCINESAMKLRFNMATLIVSCAGLIFSSLGMSTLPVLAMPVAIGVYCGWEWSRAIKMLNQIAIEQFQSSLPKTSVLEYIVRNNSIELIKQLKGDLTKLDKAGNGLYGMVCKSKETELWTSQDFKSRFVILKILADVIFTDKCSTDQKFRYFIKAIKHGHSEFIDYLLESKKVNAADFSQSQQFECLIKIVDSNTVEILKKYGFNIDAKKENYTPLLHVALSGTYSKGSQSHFTVIEHITCLLKAGADFFAKVGCPDMITYPDIICLCKDEQVKKFLVRYLSNPKRRSLSV